MSVLNLIYQSLVAAVGMFWSILWALVFGFFLSAVVMVKIPKDKILSYLGEPTPRAVAWATFFGAVSSSCSYAASSMARSLFQSRAHFIPAMAFMLASTNLVVELSAVLYVMMGWQFVLAECVGGVVLVIIASILFFIFVPASDLKAKQIEMSEPDDDTTVAQAFVSEWQMLWKDIALGLLISGFLMVMVPTSFWQKLFVSDVSAVSHFSLWRIFENALVGPIVALLSFVCSVGNIPLANVLYHGGIGFGGVLSFIYGDLIIIPLILIYKKFYGSRLALQMTVIFYVAMVLTGLAMDLAFYALGLIPLRHETLMMSDMSPFMLNYTTWLNGVSLIIAAALFWQVRRGPSESKSCCH